MTLKSLTRQALTRRLLGKWRIYLFVFTGTTMEPDRESNYLSQVGGWRGIGGVYNRYEGERNGRVGWVKRIWPKLEPRRSPFRLRRRATCVIRRRRKSPDNFNVRALRTCPIAGEMPYSNFFIGQAVPICLNLWRGFIYGMIETRT